MGKTALRSAAQNGHTSAVQALISRHDVDVDKEDGDGWTALMWATYNGHEAVVGLLLEKPGIEVNGVATSGEHAGYTALGLAIGRGHMEVIGMIRAEGGQADAPEGTGLLVWTAAKDGDLAALGRLVEWRSEEALNWANPDNDGNTPLTAACFEGEVEAVRLLLATEGKRRYLPTAHTHTNDQHLH